MHSIAFVLLPADVVDVRAAIKALFAPFHIELEADPYKEYLSDHAVKYWASMAGIRQTGLLAANAFRVFLAFIFKNALAANIGFHGDRGMGSGFWGTR